MKKILYILLFTFTICEIQSQTERDKKFITCVGRAGLMEIKLSELAQTNSLAIEVKDMGKRLIEDHTKTNSDLKLLADRKSIPFPNTLNKKQQKAFDKMVKLKSDAFDKHYIKCLKKNHHKMKCELRKEIKKGNDVDLATWSQSSMPVIQHHQDMLKAACKSIHTN